MTKTMKKQLHDLIAECLGMDGSRVIWSYAGGIRPPLPFALLRVYGNGAAAGAVISRTDAPGVLSVRTPHECRLSVQYFSSRGEDPEEKLAGLSQQLSAPSVVDRLFSLGISVFSIGDVNDISTILDDLAYEKRAAVELSVRYDRAVTDDVGYIETVEVHEKIDDLPERIVEVKVKGEFENGNS